MKTIQKIRRISLFISFSTFPLTLYYFSPYLPVVGATRGIITGSIFTFLFMFATSLFFGRAICAYLCPAGAMQQFLSSANNRPVRKGKWIKFLIWLPWITFISFLLVRAGGIKELDFFFLTTRGISIAEPGDYIIYYSVGSLIAILALAVGRRSACHHICWMSPFMIIGKKISQGIRLPRLQLSARKDGCTGCQSCTAHCPMSLEVHMLIKTGKVESTDCILCGECVAVCPEKILSYRFGR